MDEFSKAQRFFNEYEKGGGIGSLKQSLEIIDSLIGASGSQKASNFKQAIGRHIDAQIKEIVVRCNLKDFSENLKDFDGIITFLSSSLSNEDAVNLFHLLGINSDYFVE